MRGASPPRCHELSDPCRLLLSSCSPLFFSVFRQDRKLQRSAEDLKKAHEAKARLTERIRAMREECLPLSAEQGEAVHNFLVHEDTKEIFKSKLPVGSDQRHFYDVRRGCCACFSGGVTRVLTQVFFFFVWAAILKPSVFASNS